MKWEIVGRTHGVVCIVWGKANFTTCRYAKNLVKTVPISMRVMWKFVNLHSRHQEKESLRKWWQERNDTVIKEKKLKRIYWRHQRAADTDPDLWSIQVLYSAIVDGNVTTTLDQRKALHFLSNTPENVTEQQYTDFCKKLEKHYETLLKDAAGDFVKSLRGKTYCLRDLLSLWAYFIYIIAWGIGIKYILFNHFMYQFAKK